MQNIYQSHVPSVLNRQIQRAERCILKVKILKSPSLFCISAHSQCTLNVSGEATCWSIHSIASISAVADLGFYRQTEGHQSLSLGQNRLFPPANEVWGKVMFYTRL